MDELNPIAKQYRTCRKCQRRTMPAGRYCYACEYDDYAFHPKFLLDPAFAGSKLEQLSDK